MYRLVFLTGPQKGRRVTVKQGDVLIGRSPEAHLRFTHGSVADRHATIEQQPEGCVIVPQSMSAPVKVNGRAVLDRAVLAHGDEVLLGEESFLFQLLEPKLLFQKRRITKFHRLTFASVTVIVAIQLVIVAGLYLFWRLDPIPIQEADAQEEVSPDALEELEEMLGRHEVEETVPEDIEGDTTDQDFHLLPDHMLTPSFMSESIDANSGDDR